MVASRLGGAVWRCAVALLLALGGLAPQAGAGELPQPIRQALRQAGLPGEALVLAVAPVDGAAAPLLRWQAEAMVNPASVMKLVTTYAALDLLGPRFVWHTRFWVDGPVSGGLLRGNLYVQGGGDPKWVVERIRAALAAVREAGVTAIHGDLVLDQSLFEVPAVDPGAFDGEPLRPYNARPEALLVNFKAVVLQFEPDAAAGVARVRHEPPLQGVAVQDRVALDGAAPCGDWRSRLLARLEEPDAIRFAGRYPARCGVQSWPVAYVQPQSFAARALEAMWRAEGGALTGRVRLGEVPRTARLWVNAESLPLAAVVQDVNKYSNNVMAQQVFLTLGLLPPAAGAEPAGLAPRVGPPPLREGPTSFERARARLAQWWAQRFGPQLAAPVLDNGSGLSRQERISADALVALLRAAAQQPELGEVLMASLPVAGVDGTARRMGERGILRYALGQAWVKTGSLRDVASVAGYVRDRSGRLLALAAIVNHPQAAQARGVLDAVLEWAAASGGPQTKE